MSNSAAPVVKRTGKEKPHVTLANVPTPPHSYVEEIRTPTRGSAKNKECKTPEEWALQRHAHVDDDTISPHGFVNRVQTPLHVPEDGAFPATAPEGSGSDVEPRRNPTADTLAYIDPAKVNQRPSGKTSSSVLPKIIVVVAVAGLAWLWMRRTHVSE